MWAKKGTQPYVPTRSQHQKRLNVFGWVDPVNGFHGMMKAEKGDTTGFLKMLMRIIIRFKGKIIDLWVDNARWHKGVRILVNFTTDSAAKLPLYKPFIFLLSMI
ncbi:hypothetical protein [Candidatus Hakubella thermalkaliphila]|uniref:hypothetical protein n=1 Tax=Candidatus Hakubella thermalkaliphila TaxID=2754717 RepID=UPI00387EB883